MAIRDMKYLPICTDALLNSVKLENNLIEKLTLFPWVFYLSVPIKHALWEDNLFCLIHYKKFYLFVRFLGSSGRA